jgi:hypothetical protein
LGLGRQLEHRRGQAVEERGCHFGVTKHTGPIAKGQVGRDDDRGALVEPADQMKEQLTAGLSEWQVAELVENRIVSVNFARVEDVLPLQGADIVATESYWHAIEWLKLSDAALPRARLRHYTANTYYESSILDREAIAKLPFLPLDEEPS